MATRSKANSAVSVRSKLEILEKRRLLSTTLPLDPSAAVSTGSVSDISQPSTPGADGTATATSTATDTTSSDPTTSLVLPTDPLASSAAGTGTTTDSTDDSSTVDTTISLTDPITPISFDDIGSTLSNPVSVIVDVTAPIRPVTFGNPVLPTDPTSTDPAPVTDPTTPPVDTTTTPADPVVDPTTPTDPVASTDPTTPADPAATTDTTTDPTTTSDPVAPSDPTTVSTPVVPVDPTPVIDPTSGVDPVTTGDPTTTPDAPVTTDPTGTPIVAPVVVTVPIVDQTDLGDSTPTATPSIPTTPTASIPASDSGAPQTPVASTPVNSSTASAAPILSQPTDDQASDADPVFMHVSLPPMLGGNHDGVSGFHPVYVPTASNTQQTSGGDLDSSTRSSSTISDTGTAQNRSSVHENLVSGTTSAVAQATFSSTLIQPAQPATPAPAPLAEPAPAIEADPVALVVDHAMDVTGPREEAAQLAEEHLKLTRLVWTFPTIEPQQQAAKTETAPSQAQTAGATVAPVAAATSDGPGVIQLVQEIDVAPTDAATQAVAKVNGKAIPRVVEVPVARAGMSSALNDSAGRSRNIVLAVAAGAASLAVQSYRSSRRKLAAAARAAHLDPLAAWLDDPEFDRHH